MKKIYTMNIDEGEAILRVIKILDNMKEQGCTDIALQGYSMIDTALLKILKDKITDTIPECRS